MDDDELNAWFVSAVLPLEPRLLAYFRRHWKLSDEWRDMLHDVYEKTLEGASRGLPWHTPAYVFTIARNILITKARRAHIVSFDLVADMDAVPQDHELLTPERHANGREQLRRAMEGMEQLPPRCREIVRLRKVEGLPIREIADHLNVSVKAVERQLTAGMRVLTDFMLAGGGGAPRMLQEHAARPKKGASHE